jgi:hypothetical protein
MPNSVKFIGQNAFSFKNNTTSPLKIKFAGTEAEWQAIKGVQENIPDGTKVEMKPAEETK